MTRTKGLIFFVLSLYWVFGCFAWGCDDRAVRTCMNRYHDEIDAIVNRLPELNNRQDLLPGLIEQQRLRVQAAEIANVTARERFYSARDTDEIHREHIAGLERIKSEAVAAANHFKELSPIVRDTIPALLQALNEYILGDPTSLKSRYKAPLKDKRPPPIFSQLDDSYLEGYYEFLRSGSDYDKLRQETEAQHWQDWEENQIRPLVDYVNEKRSPSEIKEQIDLAIDDITGNTAKIKVSFEMRVLLEEAQQANTKLAPLLSIIHKLEIRINNIIALLDAQLAVAKERNLRAAANSAGTSVNYSMAQSELRNANIRLIALLTEQKLLPNQISAAGERRHSADVLFNCCGKTRFCGLINAWDKFEAAIDIRKDESYCRNNEPKPEGPGHIGQ